MNDIDIKIKNAFNKLPDGYWDFIDYDTSALVHGVHKYPAVMVYPISRAIIDIVTRYKEINSLLDMFLGSGTVLIEGALSNIPNLYGTDLNPLAVMISKCRLIKLNDNDVCKTHKLLSNIENDINNYEDQINDINTSILLKYDISSKDGWGINAIGILADFKFEKSILEYVPKRKNLGYWFNPKAIMYSAIIKKNIINSQINNDIKSLFNVSFSEYIRNISNTRNGEFKLYRIESHKILKNYVEDYFKIFKDIVIDNLNRILLFNKRISAKHNIDIRLQDSRYLNHIKNESIDIIITSPPYGDSHTTVAYGQFSRLSSEWLNHIESEDIDSILLGGKRVNRYISDLQSPTLEKVYREIATQDIRRANEVLSFYFDLDDVIKEVSRKTKKDGYQFWVVGNRTVKKCIIKTDEIIKELSTKYNLKWVDSFYRNISNKVMPSKNSPTNIAGEVISTMTKETILFLKKE